MNAGLDIIEPPVAPATVSAIETRHLTVAYGSRTALWNVDVEIPRHAMTGIIGPNGAGKSTLIKTMLGIVPNLAGRVNFHPDDASAVAYVPQRSSVDWDFPATVFDLVLMGTYGRLRWFQRPGRRERADAMEALARVRMEAFADRQIGELSGGQQQRIFLARAFAQHATLYLLDEPFAGIDATTENLLIEILRELRDRGNTVVMVHHDLTTVSHYFDHVVLLNERVIACGPTETAFTPETVQIAYGIPTELDPGDLDPTHDDTGGGA